MSNETTSAMNNDTEVAEKLFYLEDGWNLFVSRVFVWLFPCLTLPGGLMNAACFVVTAANRKSFPRNSRIYMMLISGTDAVLLLVKGPMYYLDVIATLVQDPWPWYKPVRDISPAVTRVYYIVSYMTVFGAPFFHLGLTVDRAVAICFPMKAKLLMNRRNSAVLLAVVLALALSFPALSVYLVQYDSDAGHMTVTDDETFYNLYSQYELFVGRILLAVSLVLGTAVICLMLARSARAFGAGAGGSGDSVGGRRSSKVIRLSLVLVFLNVNFILFNLPWSILSILEDKGVTAEVPRDQVDLMFECFNMMLFLNGVLNWFAYFMGQGFRDNFAATFRLSCHGKGPASNSGRGASSIRMSELS